jgi:hypothetical protein
LFELCHVTVVPTFTQKGAFPLAFGISGVAVAIVPPLRLISTTQGVELDPHVVLALHILPGFVSEQRYLLLLLLESRADRYPAIKVNTNTGRPHQIAILRRIVMRLLHGNEISADRSNQLGSRPIIRKPR